MTVSAGAFQFGRIRSILWPIHSWEIKKFLPMLLIYILICFNYNILRAVKDSLVITAPGCGAEALPFIKVWAVFPMAILSTYLFGKLSNRFSQDRVFYIMMAGFIGFFLLFQLVLFPLRDLLHPNALADSLSSYLPLGFKGLISIFRNWTFTLFYVMAELWGTTIMTVLFWGFTNQITTVENAKRYYSILGVGANLSTILAGQLAILLSGNFFDLSFFFGNDPWQQSLGLITFVVVAAGIAAVIIFRYYYNHLLKTGEAVPVMDKSNPPQKIKMSLKKNFLYLAQSKYLICIAVIVITYNIATNMIEIVWKDQVKLLYPDPSEYTVYMGHVFTMIGVMSTIIGLFFCGSVIRRFGWTFSALVTPTIILVTGVLFFSFILLRDSKLASLAGILGFTPLALSVFFGSAQYCISRACKYTLFDATKEIAFIPLSPESKLKGKAAIDGVGSRLGKSGGSIFHQGLLMIFGSVSLSTPFVGMFLLVVIFAYIISVKSLGTQFTELTSHGGQISIPDAEKQQAGEVVGATKEALA